MQAEQYVTLQSFAVLFEFNLVSWVGSSPLLSLFVSLAPKTHTFSQWSENQRMPKHAIRAPELYNCLSLGAPTCEGDFMTNRLTRHLSTFFLSFYWSRANQIESGACDGSKRFQQIKVKRKLSIWSFVVWLYFCYFYTLAHYKWEFGVLYFCANVTAEGGEAIKTMSVCPSIFQSVSPFVSTE